MNLEILYRDAELLVVNKPPLMLSHPTRHHPGGTLLNGLLELLAEGPEHPHLVHRLDRGTSGALLVALNREMASLLSKEIQNRRIYRIYRAYAWGKTPDEPFSVTAPIGKDGPKWKAYSQPDRGKPARTDFRLQRCYSIALYDRIEWISVLECELKTGRTHQVRLHAQFAGYPLVGDESYGDEERDRLLYSGPLRDLSEIRRPALHAEKLTFRHPSSGKTVEIRAPLPPDLRRLEKFLENSGRRV